MVFRETVLACLVLVQQIAGVRKAVAKAIHLSEKDRRPDVPHEVGEIEQPVLVVVTPVGNRLGDGG